MDPYNHPSSPNFQHPYPSALPQPKPRRVSRLVKTLAGVVLFFLLAALAIGLSSCSSAPVTSVQKPTVTKPAEHATKAQPKSHLTSGQRQALRKADLYLSLPKKGWSKAGLEAQLHYDKFPKADAKFAVNHEDVNWKKQAAVQAKVYLSFTGYSKAGLVDQLEFDKFTHAQAVYGATKALK